MVELRELIGIHDKQELFPEQQESFLEPISKKRTTIRPAHISGIT
jgi:hypothetical protein